MIDAQLGAPLDKAQQCSAWGRRPLAPEQLRYAADDAACLLALLDDLICSVPPEALPLGGDGSRGENGSTAGAGAGECSRQRGAGSACACEHASSSGPSSSTIGSSSQGQQTVEASGSGWTGMACGAAALQSAAEWWGSRLEVSGGRAVRQRLSRRARAKQQREAEKAEPEGAQVGLPHAHYRGMHSKLEPGWHVSGLQGPCSRAIPAYEMNLSPALACFSPFGLLDCLPPSCL